MRVQIEEINMHVQTVCTRPSPPPILEGLGTRLVSLQRHSLIEEWSSQYWHLTRTKASNNMINSFLTKAE